MDKYAKEALKQYQSEYMRVVEENFAQILSENDGVRVFFINEDRAFTDGRNIVVDPAAGEVFCDQQALLKTETWMGVPHQISGDCWHGLYMMTRSQNIHETLHILYTRFPLFCLSDKRATTKVRVATLNMISNIIEDCFIEAAGCSEYDNLEFYLLFGRISRIFASASSEGTVAQVFGTVQNGQKQNSDEQFVLLKEYLEYMAGFLLYPMLRREEPIAGMKEYVEQTKQLFLDGSICGDAKTRYEFTDRIFDLIESLIPDSNDVFDTTVLERMLGGTKTHSSNQATMANGRNNPKSGTVTRKLTTDLDGHPLAPTDFTDQMQDMMGQLGADKKAALSIITNAGRTVTFGGCDYDCAAIHKDIRMIEEKPKINLNLKKAYQNLYNKYHININSYNSRFRLLLKVQTPARESRKMYGSGVDSRQFGDVKRRYWYKNTTEADVPDIAVILMIDGSGSMMGARVESARIASVILHEVLKKNGMEHAIVEHRAIYDEPTVKHNILVDFHARDEEKYNILKLDAAEGTREGMSLYWAERYIRDHSCAEQKLIIVLSDGVPAHGLEGPGCYLPPVSVKDTANAVRKIMKRGTDIIAVALDESGYSCYDQLKEIYPNVIACTDLKKLTGQLLGVVSKRLEYMLL